MNRAKPNNRIFVNFLISPPQKRWVLQQASHRAGDRILNSISTRPLAVGLVRSELKHVKTIRCLSVRILEQNQRTASSSRFQKGKHRARWLFERSEKKRFDEDEPDEAR